MNPQRVSEIFFEETYRVPAHQTARSLFLRLPHGLEYAQTLIECLATSYLIAVVESICIREMQRHVDPFDEVVVGRTVRIDHLGPIPPMTCLRLCGWVERLSDRSATFDVRVLDDQEVVFDGTVTLVAARPTLIGSRIFTKVIALHQARATLDLSQFADFCFSANALRSFYGNTRVSRRCRAALSCCASSRLGVSPFRLPSLTLRA